MSKPYTVVRGDNLTAIARRFGLKTWQELYNNPENAAFRAKRPNPNLIFPGDLLMVPDGAAPAPPTPARPGSLVIEPFKEATPFLIATRSHNLLKEDLNSSPSAPRLPATRAGAAAGLFVESQRRLPTFALEHLMREELMTVGAAGLQSLSDFITNNLAKQEISYGFDSPLASLVIISPEFKRADTQVRKDITLALSDSAGGGVLDYHVLRQPDHKVTPPSINFSDFQKLHVLIGAAQDINIFLEDFSADATSRTYTATLIYEIFDHFGSDDSDLVLDTSGHGSPGQIALWVLQRERHPGHQPFVVKVMIETVGSDKF